MDLSARPLTQESGRRHPEPDQDTGSSNAPVDRPLPLVSRGITRFRGGTWTIEHDLLAGEEPLEIRLQWQTSRSETAKQSIAVTMRTPGDDFALAAGFLFGEGIIAGSGDLVDISYCKDEGEAQAFNIVTVTLRPGLTFDAQRLERNFYTTSSCGVCGKASLEALSLQGCLALTPGFTMAATTLCALPASMREGQAVFSATGGLHAAGLFDGRGRLVALKEDVGRHNAVDKLIGERILAGRHSLEDFAVCLSGRAGFELLQKALVARIPVVAAVGAPSSLAVQLAEEFGITLAGFVRPEGFNLYTGAARIQL